MFYLTTSSVVKYDQSVGHDSRLGSLAPTSCHLDRPAPRLCWKASRDFETSYMLTRLLYTLCVVSMRILLPIYLVVSDLTTTTARSRA